MGAWGVGHQANDTALDFIGSHEKGLKKSVKSGELQQSVITAFFHDDTTSTEILAATEWLLDKGFKTSAFRHMLELIENALDYESQDGVLACWGDAAERKAAVDLLRDRLNGKQVSLGATNEGLLSRIAKMVKQY